PAAFSFICPTEVLAFQSRFEELDDRNCAVAFVSVDIKHRLWHWQNTVGIPLLSDPSHRMSRDCFRCLVEGQEFCLRGMSLLNPMGAVQQVYMYGCWFCSL
ncbi:hypothetical protein K432DRAFT_312422, partial [Lepidopterella palustris CBS 459.81]